MMLRLAAAGSLSLSLLLAVGCGRAPAPQGDAPPQTLMRAPGTVEAKAAPEIVFTPPDEVDVRTTTRWPPASVTSGEAWISCTLDYADAGNGQPLASLDFFAVLDAMAPCQTEGVVRLSYKGKVASDFTALVQRVAAMATRMGIRKRVLDLDSSGGQVEDAIRAGDAIGESRWTIWVREGAVCHSSCVLVLAGGDDRVVSGQVGVHRMMRMKSKARTRAELSAELEEIYAQVQDYLERNGVSPNVADLMMTVPNRRLRLLTEEEMARFGLSGPNAAQDDLERIALMRQCGEEFVFRRDAFLRSYESECAVGDLDVDARNACGIALRQRFGFPDAACPDESPLSEFDRPLPPAPAEVAAAK